MDANNNSFDAGNAIDGTLDDFWNEWVLALLDYLVHDF